MALIKKFRIKSFKEQKTLLQLDKVSKCYDKRRILNDISFKVNRSEVLGLLGPNGVGKSTIFKIIMNIEQQKSGKIFMNGIDCSNLPIYERSRKFHLSYCSSLVCSTSSKSESEIISGFFLPVSSGSPNLIL